MTIARAHLVDPTVTRWYHCVTRCVRRAFLLGEGMYDRKSWIVGPIRESAAVLSIWRATPTSSLSLSRSQRVAQKVSPSSSRS